MRYFFVVILLVFVFCPANAREIMDHEKRFAVVDGYVWLGRAAFINGIEGDETYFQVDVWSDRLVTEPVFTVYPYCKIRHGERVLLVKAERMPDSGIWIRFESDGGCSGWVPAKNLSEKRLKPTLKRAY